MCDRDAKVTTDKQSESKKDVTYGTGIGLAIGVGLGVALGLVINNLGLGIALGAAFGLVFGFAVPSTRKKKSPSS
jgi:hypothetical protein